MIHIFFGQNVTLLIDLIESIERKIVWKSKRRVRIILGSKVRKKRHASFRFVAWLGSVLQFVSLNNNLDNDYVSSIYDHQFQISRRQPFLSFCTNRCKWNRIHFSIINCFLSCLELDKIILEEILFPKFSHLIFISKNTKSLIVKILIPLPIQYWYSINHACYPM